MTSTVTMHVDGSRVIARDRSVQGLGWAVVACHQDQLLEEHGVFTAKPAHPVGGYHEHVAFVQGVLLSHRLGVAMTDLTIVCDDDTFGYAPTWLHEQNYLPSRRDSVLKRLAFTVKQFFEPHAESLVLQAFEQARIVKVKGHRLHAYQERADYLAKHHARRVCGYEVGAMLSFESWLRQGIEHYVSHDQPPQTWYAPFVQPDA